MLDQVRSITGAKSVERGEEIQSLWSGYGSIFRVHLSGVELASVIVKHVCPPTERRHPRGWHSDRGHARKLASYEIESRWYATYASRCNPSCRVPAYLGGGQTDTGSFLVLEDLDASGYPGRLGDIDDKQLDRCLRWLASFHATFLHVAPEGLWPVGTYWHLEPRPDELAVMAAGRLHDCAAAIDTRLSTGRFGTFVHGDAKLANFCVSPDDVAAVDFQYVGGGCGMKDVAYLFSSALTSAECEAAGPGWLDRYFTHLRVALGDRPDLDELESEWRALYVFAWADFQRFLEGWSPGHWKLGPYADRMTSEALAQLP